MTKQELLAQGLELIQNSTTDKKKTKEQLAEDFKALLAQYKGTKSSEKSVAKPKTIEIDGLTYVWCSRHEQYELNEQFTIGKDGKYDAMCDAAVKQWHNYTRDISKAEKLTMTLIEDVEALREHLRHINDLKALRASTHGYNDSKPTEGVYTMA